MRCKLNVSAVKKKMGRKGEGDGWRKAKEEEDEDEEQLTAALEGVCSRT